MLVYKAGLIATNSAKSANNAQESQIARLLLGGLTEFEDIRPVKAILSGEGGLPESSPAYRVGVYSNDPFGKTTFGGSGFKDVFLKASEPYSNRVRHAPFYMAAGMLLGIPAATRTLRQIEGSSEANRPDITLGF